MAVCVGVAEYDTSEHPPRWDQRHQLCGQGLKLGTEACSRAGYGAVLSSAKLPGVTISQGRRFKICCGTAEGLRWGKNLHAFIQIF